MQLNKTIFQNSAMICHLHGEKVGRKSIVGKKCILWGEKNVSFVNYYKHDSCPGNSFILKLNLNVCLVGNTLCGNHTRLCKDLPGGVFLSHLIVILQTVIFIALSLS